MKADNKYSWLEKIKDISIIITCISLVTGIFVSLSNLRNSYEQSRFAEIENVKKIVANELEIKDNIALFLSLYSELPPLDSLLKKYGCGRAIYFSRDLEILKLFRKITHHYEIVGVLVNAEYLDFKLYYQIISFPDDFYIKTRSLREFIKGNWHGENKPMKDFLSNFENLKHRYEIERKKEQ